MELDLQKEHFDCYRPGTALVSDREETAETIVPDYNPDIARIVDVSACLLLRSQTVSEGKLTAAGSVKLTLLYISEDAPGLRAMEYTIPFEQSEKLPEGCEAACVEGRVCSAEARLLNPRKLLTRVDVEWRITPYCRTTLTTCGEIPEQEAYAIQTLCERHEVSLIRSVSEKDFIFSDELSLPGGREAIREMLCSRVKLRTTETKSIGSKVILKGVACVSLLYEAGSGEICCYAEELPFSQILDGISEEEGGEAAASTVLNLSGCEVHTGGENGGADDRTVSLKLFLSAFVILRVTQTVHCITDLYSTACELDAQTKRIELWRAPELTSVTQSVREQLDTGTEVRRVLDADVCFGSAALRQDGARTMLCVPAAVTVLYLDESNAPLAVSRRLEITAEAAADGNTNITVENVCAGDITASINANGVEVRFPAEFTLLSTDVLYCDCLESLSAAAPETTDAKAPSLVLRALGEGETLWDIAKQYRATVEDILAANELTDGLAPEIGQMLLIPRKH